MRMINRKKGAIADATAREATTFKSDSSNSVFHVFRMVLTRMGLPMEALSYAMGYKSPSSVRNRMACVSTKASYTKRTLIQAVRDLGATEDEMSALIRAYVIETGDTSFIKEKHRARLAAKAVDILREEGELYRPDGLKCSPFVSREKLAGYFEKKARAMESAGIARAKKEADNYRAKWRWLNE